MLETYIRYSVCRKRTQETQPYIQKSNLPPGSDSVCLFVCMFVCLFFEGGGSATTPQQFVGSSFFKSSLQF